MKIICLRAVRVQLRRKAACYRSRLPTNNAFAVHARGFNSTKVLRVIKPFLLADIGEGIREVQIIQWFVQPGARVEQFDKLCEVSSDKATVEITSRFDGIIKKLHYEADDMALVGKPLVDIDIQSEISSEDEALTKISADEDHSEESEKPTAADATQNNNEAQQRQSSSIIDAPSGPPTKSNHGKFSTLATPAVRHAAKQHNVDIASVAGTGKDGRVLKEDVHKHVSSGDHPAASPLTEGTNSNSSRPAPQPSSTIPKEPPPIEDHTVPLTPTQFGMFKTMTASLAIPHFLYSTTIDLTALTALRHATNGSISRNASSSVSQSQQKFTLLPFLLKAVSMALLQHPLLNARLDIPTGSPKPSLRYRGTHNLGIAVDTPSGLLVPVIPSVQTQSITSLASQITHFAALARAGKLQPKDMQGATFTVSNIGSVGNGGVVAPVIVERQVGILGVGRSKIVPAFGEKGELVAREECILSWSADHRIVDGGTVARCAERVRVLLENPGEMLVQLK